MITAEHAQMAADAFRGRIPTGLRSTAVTHPGVEPAIVIGDDEQIAAFMRAALRNYTREQTEMLWAQVYRLSRLEAENLREWMRQHGYEDENEVPGERLAEPEYLQALALAIQAAIVGPKGSFRPSDEAVSTANAA